MSDNKQYIRIKIGKLSLKQALFLFFSITTFEKLDFKSLQLCYEQFNAAVSHGPFYRLALSLSPTLPLFHYFFASVSTTTTTLYKFRPEKCIHCLSAHKKELKLVRKVRKADFGFWKMKQIDENVRSLQLRIFQKCYYRKRSKANAPFHYAVTAPIPNKFYGFLVRGQK